MFTCYNISIKLLKERNNTFSHLLYYYILLIQMPYPAFLLFCNFALVLICITQKTKGTVQNGVKRMI